MQNTADAVLRDGIGRGLEALFGNPQPPENAPPQSMQPLTFLTPSKLSCSAFCGFRNNE